jgi:hypothetical protein
MPTKSVKQERFMQAVAHNPKFAKQVGVPTSVGKEFTKSGGGMATKMNAGFMAMMKKKAGDKPAKKMAVGGMHKMPDGKMMKDSAMKHGGKVKNMASGGLAGGHKSADGIATKGKTKARQVTMKKGGMC